MDTGDERAGDRIAVEPHAPGATAAAAAPPGVADPIVRCILESVGLLLLWALLLFVLTFFVSLNGLKMLALLWAVCAGHALHTVAKRRTPEGREASAWGAFGPSVVVAAVAGAVFLAGRWTPEASLLRLDDSSLERTAVLSHPSLPVPEGKNALWCASFQVHWDELRKTLGGGPVVIDGAKAAAPVDLLNASTAADFSLPAEATVTFVGSVDDGTEGRIRGELDRKFGAGALKVDLPPSPPGSIVCFGYLERDLPFEHVFESYDEPLAFAGGESRVRAFGMNEDSDNPRESEILGQVHFTEVGAEEERSFVLEFAIKGGEDRMVVAVLPRKETLQRTWKSVEDALAAGERTVLSGQVLAVPKLNFELSHDFGEFRGASIRGLGPLLLVRQVTRFRLDERGASLQSYTVSLAGGVPERILVDRPFLLALIRKGAKAPYLLLWIENDELLDKQ